MPSDSDPHEEEKASGLIVQHSHAHTDQCADKLKRGVVMAVGTAVNSMGDGYDFAVGDVIFYHRGEKLRELEYVYPSYDNLIAYEKDSDA